MSTRLNDQLMIRFAVENVFSNLWENGDPGQARSTDHVDWRSRNSVGHRELLDQWRCHPSEQVPWYKLGSNLVQKCSARSQSKLGSDLEEKNGLLDGNRRIRSGVCPPSQSCSLWFDSWLEVVYSRCSLLYELNGMYGSGQNITKLLIFHLCGSSII